MIQWLKERRDISFLLVLKMYLHVPIGTHHLFRQLYTCTVHTDIHEHETALIFDAHLLLYIFIHAFRCILFHQFMHVFLQIPYSLNCRLHRISNIHGFITQRKKYEFLNNSRQYNFSQTYQTTHCRPSHSIQWAGCLCRKL